MNYYKVTIYNNEEKLVSTYLKNGDTPEDAILQVIKVVKLQNGDSIKIEEM